MASFLLSECLENVFLFLDEELNEPFTITNTSKHKNLRSCTLVSRYWCRISTPILYAYPYSPFHYSPFHLDDMMSYFKFIRTLLSCLPQIEIRQIYTTDDTQGTQGFLSK